MKMRIYEMPLDLGASRHGSVMGPAAIRLAGLEEQLNRIGVTVEEYFSPMDIPRVLTDDEGSSKAKYLKPITAACARLAPHIERAVADGVFPLVIGGDHSISLGSVAGFAAACKKLDKTPAVLYVDAHGDFNTHETSPSGNIHGMCMAASCGFGLSELTNLYYADKKISAQNLCYLGVRDLDYGERELMKSAGVTVFSMTQIDRMGFAAAVYKALEFFKTRDCAVHLSLDMDVMDPSFAPGVGIEAPGGLSYREVLLLMEELSASGVIVSAEIVEVNPVLDVRNQTAKMAVEIISRLLGETVY